MTQLLQYDHATEEVIVRDLTEQELEAIAQVQAKSDEIRQELEAKATAKAALLERLGISAEEAALLLG